MAEIKTATAPTAVAQKKETATASTRTKPRTMKDYVAAMEPEIAKALPSMIKPERFIRTIYSALSVNPKLSACTPQSFLAAMMNSAQAGLEANTATAEAYIIPYNDHGVPKAQFQISYIGLIRLAQRAGTTVRAETVYENDKFEYELGQHPKMVHVPALKDRGNPIGYYAVWNNAGLLAEGFTFMSVEDVQKHARKYSKAYDSSSSPWHTNFDAMARKTVIKQALKYAPLSVEIQRIMDTDDTVKSSISDDMTDVPADINLENIMDAEVVDSETGEVLSNS